VVQFIGQHFVPVRVHVKDQRDEYARLAERFNAQWTPTTLVVDPSGTERHRIEGFLPTRDFLAQLALGLAHSAFGRSRFADAERLFSGVVEEYPETDAAAEALYWAGVSSYKHTGDAVALQQTATNFRERYRDTPWAKKASVWGG
jgi:TolA-binding protein